MARRGDTIELAVLGLLHEGPMHGYELRKRLNLMLGWGRVLSYGSLYPALKKMLRSNLIEETTVSSTPVTKRPRIVYQVTESGHEEFERLMSEVWDPNWFGSTKTLDVTIGRLRTKLEQAGLPDRVVSIRGVGFRLEHTQPAD